MSGPPGSRPDLYAASRRHAKRLLRREIRALHAAGTRTLIFEPGRSEQQVMGDDLMSAHRLTEVIQQSFLAAGAKAAAPQIRDLMRAAAASPYEWPDRSRRPGSRAGPRPVR
jgi:NTE family protein